MPDDEQKRIIAQNLSRLVNESRKQQKEICHDLKINTSTFNMWCTGKSLPNVSQLKILAKYFNVYLSDIVDFQDCEKSDLSDNTYYINKDTREIAQEIFENKELRLLFDTARDSQPEDLETVHQMLLALKRKERGNED